MGLPDETNASPPNMYPQTLQLKLYQAFIFSIPILFSIILILLFYLFYLKRRISNANSSSPSSPLVLPTPSIHHLSSHTSMSDEGALKGTMMRKVKLPVILFGEDPTMKESQWCCCICLGEFEEQEELHQLPTCTHVFHAHCIAHWLRSNSTCPICRTSVLLLNNHHHHHHHHEQQQQQQQHGDLSISNCNSRVEEVIITIHGDSSSSSSLNT